jgi:hypothetical protein
METSSEYTKVTQIPCRGKVESKENYHGEVSNRFAALEDFDAEAEINTVLETERIAKFQPTRV